MVGEGTYDMPLLSGIKHSMVIIRNGTHLLPRHWDRAVDISPIRPPALRTNAVELVGQLHIDAVRRQPRDGHRSEDAPTGLGLGDRRASA